MKNLTFEDVEKSVGAKKAKETWNKICNIGGFGLVSETTAGGLGIGGLDKDKQKAVTELLGKPKADKS